VSDTPNHPGSSDPTWRLDPTSSPPADPTSAAPASPAAFPPAGPPAFPAGNSDETRRLDAPAPPVPPAPPHPPTFAPQSAPPQPPAFSPQSAPPYPGLDYGQQQPPQYPSQYPPAAPGYQQQVAGYPPHPGYGYQQQQPQFDQYGRPLSDKSKVVAGVLGIALGGFGAGRFYTGHTGMAVAQLLVTIFTCGLGHFWGLIDGIMILANGGTDAEGRILRD
jgi:TM2 domain-containing membrane protein YozV